MGLSRVIAGTGHGSWFGHGRIFGFHNPLGSDIGKAGDPYINLKTLSKLSYSCDPIVRDATAENLAQRLEKPLFPAECTDISLLFNKLLFPDVLLITKQVHQASLPFFRDLIKTCKPEDLETVVKNSRSTQVKLEIIGDPRISRKTLIDLATAGLIEAYKRIEASLAAEELDKMAMGTNSDAIRSEIIKNINTSRETLINLAINGFYKAFLRLEYTFTSENGVYESLRRPEGTLTSHELAQLSCSKSLEVVQAIARHKNTSALTLANLSNIYENNLPILEIIVQHPNAIIQTVAKILATTYEPKHSWIIDEPGIPGSLEPEVPFLNGSMGEPSTRTLRAWMANTQVWVEGTPEKGHFDEKYDLSEWKRLLSARSMEFKRQLIEYLDQNHHKLFLVLREAINKEILS